MRLLLILLLIVCMLGSAMLVIYEQQIKIKSLEKQLEEKDTKLEEKDAKIEWLRSKLYGGVPSSFSWN